MITMAGAALAAGLWIWFAASTFLPIAVEGRPLEYVFVGAPPWILAIASAIAFAFLALVSRGQRSDWMRPLWLLALAPVALIALLPGAAPRLSPILYVFVDLRPWWTLAVLLVAIRRSPFTFMVARRVREGGLLLLLMAYAIAFTPQLRFDSALHGDEPKYLRFCENWYQGRGLEVGGIQTMAALGPEFSPPLWRNVELFGAAVRDELRGGAVQRPEYAEAWIIRGKNGGYYQVHNPGLSALLFPFYFVDRHFITTAARHQGVFPASLPMTNLGVLLIWAAWGVAVSRLLRALDVHSIFVLVAMWTMPVAAFGFQIYPEAAAGAIVCAALAWTVTRAPDDTRAWTAIAAGAAIGFLPWLHVRFAALSLVLVAWTLMRARRWTVAAAYAAFVLALSAYAHHITGSFRPDAMYAVPGAESAWMASEAAQSVISLPFDRIWGFFPHAPVYLFALPGWVWLVRQRPALAAVLALAVLALAVPVAGHGFTAAGATPLRQLAAVIPLLVVPLAITWREWPARLPRILFIILLVLALDTAISYNLHHYKEVGRHIDAGFSGWAPNLLFPWTHGDLWATHAGTFALFGLWILAVASLVAAALARRGVAIAAGALAVLLVVATPLGGEWTRPDYFVPAAQAHDRVVAAARRHGCQPCVSSLEGLLGRPDIRRRTRP